MLQSSQTGCMEIGTFIVSCLHLPTKQYCLVTCCEMCEEFTNKTSHFVNINSTVSNVMAMPGKFNHVCSVVVFDELGITYMNQIFSYFLDLFSFKRMCCPSLFVTELRRFIPIRVNTYNSAQYVTYYINAIARPIPKMKILLSQRDHHSTMVDRAHTFIYL